jgi:hypothetical protein
MTRPREPNPESIDELTASYETWLRRQTLVVKRDLRKKHEAMCESPFPFLRATYYAWAVIWPLAQPELLQAPRITAVGDLHMENFGTWRDGEGRLAYGINDFDEAAKLPYTSDLVRLATSASLAYETAKLRAPGVDLAAAFLDGYTTVLQQGGKPIVFAEQHKKIGKVVLRELVRPSSFWKKKMPGPDAERRAVPRRCRSALVRALPAGTTEVVILPRVAGVGSLGRPRFVAVGRWNGGLIAREAKAAVPSAGLWANGHGSRPRGPGSFEHLLRASIRSPDPFLHRSEGWVVRRLAPDTDKIEITRLGRAQELTLATLMGNEVANVHLATPGAAPAILTDLARRPAGWLVESAETMAALMVDSHEAWKKAERRRRTAR